MNEIEIKNNSQKDKACSSSSRVNCYTDLLDEIKSLMQEFMLYTEKNDKTKLSWQTKNHLPTLHMALNEFFEWLEVKQRRTL